MKRKLALLAVAAPIASALGWVAVGGTSPPPSRLTPPLPYRAAGISVSKVPAGGLATGETAYGARDDYLVQNGRIQFVLGSDTGGPERRARYGALLDIATRDFNLDELVELRPVIRIEGKWASFNMVGVTLATDAKYPFLRIEQVSKDGHLRFATDFRAAPNSPRLELVSRLYNAGETLIRSVEIGDRTRWPGAPTFAPRVGFPKLTSRAEVPWVGRQGATLSYALAFPQGPVQAQFFFDRIGQVGQETLGRAGDLPPEATLEYRRELIVVEGDLGKVAELAFATLGRKVGYIQGRLEPVPAWAVIEARYPDGKPALSVRADKLGAYSLPVPTGDYRLVLHAPGGKHEADVSVEAGKPPIRPNLIAPLPGRLRYAITDSDGAALPARLILRGIAPTADPELGPVERGGGAKNVVYSRSGEGEVELPEGRYRAVVSHGPEYEIVDQELEVDGEHGATLRAVLTRSVETSGWLAADFHLHASPSHDSSITLPDRILSLLAEGVEFAVPTDHNHVTDYRPFIAAAGAERELGTASGVEVTTTSWGHFNAYPYPARAEAPPFSGVTPVDIFSTIRARAPGSVIQVNHPRMTGVGYFNRIELDPATGRADVEGASFDFDAVEVVNGYDLESMKLIEQNLKDYFSLLNFGRRVTATGNSDSHRLIVNWAGYPRTYVRVDDDNPAKANPAFIARSVREGRVVVSNGIFLSLAANGTAGPGDTVRGRRVTLQVQARAPSWVDIHSLQVWVNGVPSVSTTVPAARGAAFTWETELEIREDSWFVVFARGQTPMSRVFVGRRVLPFAFTNPVFVDADEDGAWRAPQVPEPDQATAAP